MRSQVPRVVWFWPHRWRLRFSSCSPEQSSCAAVKVAPNLSVAAILLNSPNSLAGKPCPHRGQTEEPFPFLLYSKYHSVRRSMAENAFLAAASWKPVDCRIPGTRIESLTPTPGFFPWPATMTLSVKARSVTVCKCSRSASGTVSKIRSTQPVPSLSLSLLFGVTVPRRAAH